MLKVSHNWLAKCNMREIKTVYSNPMVFGQCRHWLNQNLSQAGQIMVSSTTEAAQKAGRFKSEIVPVTIKSRKGDIVVDSDEYPRHGTTIDMIGKLRAAFEKEGTVTAGNASGINDGAAAVVLMRAADAAKENKKVIARIVSWASTAIWTKSLTLPWVSVPISCPPCASPSWI